MSANTIALLIAMLCLTARAEDSGLAAHARQAVATQPHGCIVTARQIGETPPVYGSAGELQPTEVPTEKRVFEIGSVTKIFTGMLLAQAVLDQKAKLDTTLRDLMGPGQRFADEKVAAITLQQLATHTSGLPKIPEDLVTGFDPLDPYIHYDRAHLDAYLAKTTLAHAAPFEASYSNLGVGLLGDLLARLANKTWEQLCVERIALPLGLDDTRVTLSPEQTARLAPPYAAAKAVKPWRFDSLVGAGGLHSTAADMLKFCHALAKPESTPLQDVIELTASPLVGHTGLCLQVVKTPKGVSYGYEGQTGGYRSFLLVVPAASLSVVILTNNTAFAPAEVFLGTGMAAPAP